MNISLYPEFNEVFADNTLEGLFYPLCSVTLDKYPDSTFHFVSSNGLWIAENYETKDNTFGYTLFDVEANKYKFNGDIRLYKGFETAKAIFEDLKLDFEKQGKAYLETKMQTADYIENQKRRLNLQTDGELDADYYLQTFYEFSINRLNFEINNEFGAFRKVMDGWPKNERQSPVVYGETKDALNETLSQYDQPQTENIGTFEVIGKTVGVEFFTDGNDTVLFYNNADQVLCFNFYA